MHGCREGHEEQKALQSSECSLNCLHVCRGGAKHEVPSVQHQPAGPAVPAACPAAAPNHLLPAVELSTIRYSQNLLNTTATIMPRADALLELFCSVI